MQGIVLITRNIYTKHFHCVSDAKHDVNVICVATQRPFDENNSNEITTQSDKYFFINIPSYVDYHN